MILGARGQTKLGHFSFIFLFTVLFRRRRFVEFGSKAQTFHGQVRRKSSLDLGVFSNLITGTPRVELDRSVFESKCEKITKIMFELC